MHTGIAIVMPAKFPGSEEESHCTVAFLGNTDTAPFSRRQVESVVTDLRSSFGNMRRKFSVLGDELFGVEKNKSVLILEPFWLSHFRQVADTLLDQQGGIRPSTDWAYRPHVTLPEGYYQDYEMPWYVTLQRPILWWGNDRG